MAWDLQMYRILHIVQGKPFIIELRLVPLDELYIHEEVVPRNIRRLIDKFQKERVFTHPIIVDKNSNVVLDGMHRVTALRMLGNNYIPVSFIDYNHPAIQVKNWFRAIYPENTKNMHNAIIDILSELEINSRWEDRNTFMNLLFERKYFACFRFHYMDKILALINDENADIWSIYRKIGKIEKRIMQDLKARIMYEPDIFIQQESQKKEIPLVLMTPPLSKREVVYFARQKKLFPPKTTRHIIPMRPLFINIPMILLREDGPGRDLEEKNKIFEALLRQKGVLKLRGKLLLDRFYEEDFVYLFT